MTGTIFLSGGGNSIIYKDFDNALSKKIAGGKILCIPFANQKKSREEHVDWMNRVFNKFQKSKILIVKNVADLRKIKMNTLALVYISGGNTFQLLKKLNVEGINMLREYYAKGGTIYGSSAGAAVLGTSILTASIDDTNKVHIDSTNGCNLINGYSVYCHYKKDDQWKFDIFINEHRIKKILILPEGSIISIQNKSVRTIKNTAYKISAKANLEYQIKKIKKRITSIHT